MTTNPNTPTSVIRAEDLHFSFGRFPVIKGANLDIRAGQLVCLTGENGCGKSTVLKLLIGTYKPDSGSALLFGEPAHNNKHLDKVGYVPQATTTEKISFPITSRELVVQGLGREFGFLRIPRAEHYRRAELMLDKLGLSAITNVPFSELSGGQQQRVLIARALINEPKLLFLDEPISGVDAESRAEFLSFIETLRADAGLTVLIVTHDLEEIHRYVTVDHVYRISEGVISDAATVS